MGALIDLLTGSADTLLGMLSDLREGGFALGVPLLQFLVASLEDGCLCGAELLFVSCGLGLCFGDGSPGLFDGSGGAGTAFGQHSVEGPANQETVGCDQQNKQDHRRHSAEHKSTELIQYLVHEGVGLGRLAVLSAVSHSYIVLPQVLVKTVKREYEVQLVLAKRLQGCQPTRYR